jgi:hypothetical protein
LAFIEADVHVASSRRGQYDGVNVAVALSTLTPIRGDFDRCGSKYH